MNPTIYSDPNRFWEEVSPHLRFEEAKNSLCLGLSLAYRSNSADCLYQSALFENNHLLGAIVCANFRTNCNFLPTTISSPLHAQILFKKFQSTRLSVAGIVGEISTARVYENLFNGIGHKTRDLVLQGIYRCRKLVMPPLPKGVIFRKAEVTDIQIIAEWAESFHKEAVPHDPPIDGIEFAKTKISQNMIYVIEREGELLSMAGWGRDIETSCSINIVFTPKSQRGKGYASVVTALLTQRFLDSGKTETNLYTDMGNPTSNRIYQKIGYEFVCNSIHIGVLPDGLKR